MHAPLELPGFQQFQSAFAARLRDPQRAPLPVGAPERRMRAYEELVFNNLMSFLDPCFPVARSLLGATAWCDLGHRFLADHRCRSPLFRDIPGEFLGWVAERLDGWFPDRPFLGELMHYEWLELTLEVAADSPAEAIDPAGDLLSGEPAWNPLTRIAGYRFPVHRIGPDFQPVEPESIPCCYLLYRDAEARVRFVQLTPVSARMAELLGQGGLSGRAVCEQVAAEIGLPADEALLHNGLAQLEAFRAIGVVQGTRIGE